MFQGRELVEYQMEDHCTFWGLHSKGSCSIPICPNLGNNQEVLPSRSQAPSSLVSSKSVKQIGWGQSMKGLVCQAQNFEFNSELHWMPVEWLEHRYNVVELPHPRDQSCSTIHYVLEFVDLGLGKSNQEWITVVKAGRYQWMYCYLKGLSCQVLPNAAQVIELEMCCLDYCSDM